VRVLVIEDDFDIAKNICDFLEEHGHTVDYAADGVTGLHLAVTEHFDAILLDVALPGMSGLEICSKLRSEARSDTPILMLTARDRLEDKLAGFESGADDYLVKPFALREVEARLHALTLRHKGRVVSRVLVAGGLQFDPRTQTLTRDGKVIKLPPKCIRLIEFMMQHPGRVFSRSELENAVWGDTLESGETLRAHMYLLRRALTRPDESPHIETVHGLGYRLMER
jgi:DNA-binding response OmpR family regulator